MPKKKNKIINEKVISEKKVSRDLSDEESPASEESTIDPAILEDTFADEFSEYNDVDNL